MVIFSYTDSVLNLFTPITENTVLINYIIFIMKKKLSKVPNKSRLVELKITNSS